VKEGEGRRWEWRAKAKEKIWYEELWDGRCRKQQGSEGTIRGQKGEEKKKKQEGIPS